MGGLLHCLGVDVLDQRSQVMTRFIAPVTMLATGGAGQVYPNTTNPGVITGDGMAMAYRARASIGNMEFVQFHPTGFANPKPEKQLPGGRTFLISEAVRGEGGLLFNASGERCVPPFLSLLYFPQFPLVCPAEDRPQNAGCGLCPSCPRILFLGSRAPLVP